MGDRTTPANGGVRGMANNPATSLAVALLAIAVFCSLFLQSKNMGFIEISSKNHKNLPKF